MYYLINQLKKWNLHVVIGKIRLYLKRPIIDPKKPISKLEISVDNNPVLPNTCDVVKMDISDKRVAPVKMQIYNFLYQNQESINNIAVLNPLDSPNTFLIKGLKSSQKITVKDLYLYHLKHHLLYQNNQFIFRENYLRQVYPPKKLPQ